MYSRNQYLNTLRIRYFQTKSKKEKGRILDEYCQNTGQNRKYVIKKINYKVKIKEGQRKARKTIYDNEVKSALVKYWKIFDHPCGQRLEPLLKAEIDRLRALNEVVISDETAAKLKQISSSTIDRKLKHQKEVERINRKYHKKVHPLLYRKIPIKVMSEQDRTNPGNIQIDLVEHCGQSAAGEFINSLSTTDISSGWWEGEAVATKGQEATFEGLRQLKERYPFSWREIHSDNGTEFINWHLLRYCEKENLDFSRSRPNKKNDNCLVEQKNWTHVKKYVGYLRYDVKEEQDILNNLYRNELRLYKNFFQPVIKLKEKIRVKGKIHRRYDVAKTPYQYLMESKKISENKKEELKQMHDSLNPAELKRNIDKKLNRLYEVYSKKHQRQNIQLSKVAYQKKLKPISASFLTQASKLISVS